MPITTTDVSIPQVRLPKGGGAIKGIGETFQASSFTGTGNFSIPIPNPVARGLEPDLQLNYGSGTSQGIFGLGFSLSVPHITRRTEKRLPDYSEEDEFVLSDAEYLVPALQQEGDEWVIDERDRTLSESAGRVTYRIRRYRPRTEGAFLCIEQWTRRDGDVHWRVTTKDQITSVYGRSPDARIVHPDHPLQIFSWLLEQTEDDRGNKIQYTYHREDGAGIPQRLSERDRLQTSQVYLHKIQYGNRPDGSWAFSVVLNYGEYDLDNLQTLTTTPTQPWIPRPDPFSDYRAGFEVRTHRLCRHILVFHHFPEELGIQDCLVQAVHLTYRESPVLSFLAGVQYVGYQRQSNGEYDMQPLPPLTFGYSDFDATRQGFRPLTQEQSGNLPKNIDVSAGYQFLDLYGEGISGLLYDQYGITLYRRAQGQGRYAAPREPLAFPVERNADQPQYLVTAGLRKRVMVRSSGRMGNYEPVDEDTWTGFEPYEQVPIDYGNLAAEYLDVTGDGTPDLLLFEAEQVKVYPSVDQQGHGAAMVALRSPDFPLASQQSPTEKVLFADMGGDGLSDRVRIRNGEIAYWPNLGYGRFGTKVCMEGAPHFGEGMHESRIFLVDIDGSGTSDLVYLDAQAIWIYYNQSGNGFSVPVRIPLPRNYHDQSLIQFVDIQGNGTACLVFSPDKESIYHEFYDFTGGIKPHLLTDIDNHMGTVSQITYAPSTYFYLADQKAGRPWLTRLPFPVQLVHEIAYEDQIGRSRRVSRFAYHHGAFDFRERDFAGFGLVERWDTETFESATPAGLSNPVLNADSTDYVPPAYSKTWYHTGLAEHEGLSHQFVTEYYSQRAILDDSLFETPLADPDSVQEAHRALRGQVLREEVYGLDGTALQSHPYSVQENNYTLRLMQPAVGVPASVYMALPRESMTHQYERNSDDPRTTHRFYLRYDAYGSLTHSAELAYGRSPDRATHPDQTQTQGKYVVEDYRHLTENAYRLAIPVQTQVFELAGLNRSTYTWEFLHRAYPNPEQTAVDFDQQPLGMGARLLTWTRSLYWDESQQRVLPLGQVSARALLHHRETAMYPQEGMERLLQPTGTPGMTAKLLSQDADGGAWITATRPATGRVYYLDPGIVAFYGGGDRFYQAEEYVDQFGTISRIGYDIHRLFIVRTEARLSAQQSLVTTLTMDYHALQPARVEDVNQNVTEYRYDPLGKLRVMSHYGQEGPAQRGDRPLSAYQLPQTLSRDSILANPAGILQGATRFFFYDVMAWEEQRQPVYTLTLQREIYTTDLVNTTTSPLQITLEYFDGLGRSVQQKQRAEAGLALALNADDSVAEVQVAERWITTGWSLYNNKGWLVKMFEPFYSTTPLYQPHPALTQRGVTTLRRYDPLGRVRQLDLPTGLITRTEYGAWDVQDYDASDLLPESPFYQAQDVATRQRLIAQFGHYVGTLTRQVLDGWGRTLLQQDFLEANGQPLTTYTRLDLAGNPVQVQDPRFVGSDRTNAQMTYDMEGRLLRIVAADSGTSLRLYNAGGDEIQRWDGLGFRVSTDYDALSRPIAVWVEQGGVRRQAERIEYGETADPDGTNNLRGQIWNYYDQAGVVQFSRYTIDGAWGESRRRFRQGYDSEPNWAQNQPLETEIFNTQRLLDALGRLALVRLPDGRLVRQLHHASGRVRSLQYRDTSQAQSAFQSFINDIQYNARGQQEQVIYGNGVRTTSTYDPKTFYLTQLESRRLRDNRVLQDVRYAYDPVGNLTELVDASHRTVFNGNDRIEPRQTYRYDALYRLVGATGREHPALHRQPRRSGLVDDGAFIPLPPNPNNGNALQNYSRTYTYDRSGNLTEIQHRADVGAFTRAIAISPTSNRGIVQSDTNPNADPERAYDANGNLIQVEHLQAMRWNYRNQLISVDVIQRAAPAPSDSEFYLYDGAGRRVRKVYRRLVSNNQVELEETLYFGDYEVFRIRRDTQITQERTSTHLRLGSETVATLYRWNVRQQNDPAQQIRFRLGNYQSSVALELDETANIITYEEYYPYGGTALIAGQGDREVKRKTYRYGGRERDAITQFYDYGARSYMPWTGRWLNPDPAGFIDGLNLYQFVRGNPINFVDDTGLTVSPVKNHPSPTSGSTGSSSMSVSSATTTSGGAALNLRRPVRQRPKLASDLFTPPTPALPSASLPQSVAKGGGANQPGNSTQSSNSGGLGAAATSSVGTSSSAVTLTTKAQNNSVSNASGTSQTTSPSSGNPSNPKAGTSPDVQTLNLNGQSTLNMDLDTAKMHVARSLLALALLKSIPPPRPQNAAPLTQPTKGTGNNSGSSSTSTGNASGTSTGTSSGTSSSSGSNNNATSTASSTSSPSTQTSSSSSSSSSITNPTQNDDNDTSTSDDSASTSTSTDTSTSTSTNTSSSSSSSAGTSGGGASTGAIARPVLKQEAPVHATQSETRSR